MDKFVVGFAFNFNASSILLIKKERPTWQKGLLNGVGGKIEAGENPMEAMNRECKEETGLILDWKTMGVMRGLHGETHAVSGGTPFYCWVFYAYSDEIYNYKQIEDEFLALYDPECLFDKDIVQNLRFLIPFGKYNDGVTHLTLEYAQEKIK